MNDVQSPKKFIGTIEENPFLKEPLLGASMLNRPIFLNGMVLNGVENLTTEQLKFPTAIDSCTAKGALLGVCLDKGDGITNLIGSAFTIGAGIAITATHVLRENLDDISAGIARVVCIAFYNNRITFWEPGSISFDEKSDIAILGVSPLSSYPSDNTYYNFRLTTLTPKIGENIRIIGYRQLDNITSSESGHEFSGIADVYIVQGKVSNFYRDGRDTVMLPHPCFEVDCACFSGMSGGVALNDDGYVVGVVSSSFGDESPTYISWLISAFRLEFEFDDLISNTRLTTSLLQEATSTSKLPNRVIIHNPNNTLDSSGGIIIPHEPSADGSIGLSQ